VYERETQLGTTQIQKIKKISKRELLKATIVLNNIAFNPTTVLSQSSILGVVLSPNTPHQA
jgi:hypothetical protein